MEMNNSSDFHPSSPLSSVQPPETSLSFFEITHHNSKKKRTKLIKNGDKIPKPKLIKNPDPSAPNVTRPCTECGKIFSSWKALFGHMRCHPERQWRGINPPPNFRRREITTSHTEEDSSSLTEEDHEVATCLIMLANSPAAASDQSPSANTGCTVNQETEENSDSGTGPDQNLADGAAVGPTPTSGRFECSSCKKVFHSHQALGGHRASHKNVKGCYAITKNDGEEEAGCCSGEMMMKDHNINNSNLNGHKCTTCFRVFSSGQALGGHKRRHWEKVGEPSRVCGFDLNLVAPLQDQDDDASAACSITTSGTLALDLGLGL